MAANESSPKQSRKSLIFRTLIFIGAIFGLLALALIGYSYPGTGFGSSTIPKSNTEDFIPAKTLWDWLQLLIVPAALAFVAVAFNVSNTRAEREAAAKREKTDRDIAVDNAQEALLQSYLDRMTDLLLKNELRAASMNSEVRAVAAARTTTVLRRLDQKRRASLLTFLRGSNLLDKASVGLLRGADLSGADLYGARLRDVDLSHANLDDANLSTASLTGAYLIEADLSDANLSDARLRNANLADVNLRNANLQRAALFRTNLTGADLYEADMSSAYLIRADLSNTNLGSVNLRNASLISVVLRNAYLGIASLGGANLVNVDLTNVDLSGVDLSDASLRGADLRGADLRGANLRGTKYDASTKWPDGFKLPPNVVEIKDDA